MVAGPLIRDLLEHGLDVTVTSLDLAAAEKLTAGHPCGHPLPAGHGRKRQVLAKLIADCDLTVSLLPPPYTPQVRSSACATAAMVTAQLRVARDAALDAEAHATDLVFLNEIGVDPGIDHMSAMRVIDGVKRPGGEVRIPLLLRRVAGARGQRQPLRLQVFLGAARRTHGQPQRRRVPAGRRQCRVAPGRPVPRHAPAAGPGCGRLRGLSQPRFLSYIDVYGLQAPAPCSGPRCATGLVRHHVLLPQDGLAGAEAARDRWYDLRRLGAGSWAPSRARTCATRPPRHGDSGRRPAAETCTGSVSSRPPGGRDAAPPARRARSTHAREAAVSARASATWWCCATIPGRVSRRTSREDHVDPRRLRHARRRFGMARTVSLPAAIAVRSSLPDASRARRAASGSPRNSTTRFWPSWPSSISTARKTTNAVKPIKEQCTDGTEDREGQDRDRAMTKAKIFKELGLEREACRAPVAAASGSPPARTSSNRDSPTTGELLAIEQAWAPDYEKVMTRATKAFVAWRAIPAPSAARSSASSARSCARRRTRSARW